MNIWCQNCRAVIMTQAESDAHVCPGRDSRNCEEQCKERHYRGELDDPGAYLCCRFVAGHPGKHATLYEGRGQTQWETQAPSATPEKK